MTSNEIFDGQLGGTERFLFTLLRLSSCFNYIVSMYSISLALKFVLPFRLYQFCTYSSLS